MVDMNLVKIQIQRKHDKEFDGGHRIFVGGTDKNPVKLDLNLLMKNPEVFKNTKLPFEAEILDAPDIPEVIKKLVSLPVKETKKEKLKETKAKQYFKEDLEKMSFGKLKKLAKGLGETGRSKLGLIKDILKAQ